MVFWIPQHLARFLCLLPRFAISIRSGRKWRLPAATSTEKKNRKAENVGKFPIHLRLFHIFAIKLAVGKLKLLIPRAFYSL